MTDAPPDVTIDDILAGFDLLVDRLERYAAQLEAELGAAEATEDHRYAHRVRRGVTWANDALGSLDDVLEQLGSLRHNDSQLVWARQGRMV